MQEGEEGLPWHLDVREGLSWEGSSGSGEVGNIIRYGGGGSFAPFPLRAEKKKAQPEAPLGGRPNDPAGRWKT